MSFKKVSDYNEERYGNMFLLRNDGDQADVILLYRSIDDALVADVHYIKSPDYSGYVHCCGRNCPACNKGIRVQNKLFIPLYNVATDEIQFFDRSVRFENVLNNAVFSKYPNPSEFVFRIVRHGQANSMDTTYEIYAVGRNTNPAMSYDNILKSHNIEFPDGYNRICKDVSSSELSNMLNVNNSTSNMEDYSMPNYQVTPRVSSNAPTQSPVDINLNPIDNKIDGSDDAEIEENVEIPDDVQF